MNRRTMLSSVGGLLASLPFVGRSFGAEALQPPLGTIIPHTIKRVKILGDVSNKGRTYSEKALRDCIALFEGVEVTFEGRVIGKVRNLTLGFRGVYGVFDIYNGRDSGLFWKSRKRGFAIGVLAEIDPKTNTVKELRQATSLQIVESPSTTCGLYS